MPIQPFPSYLRAQRLQAGLSLRQAAALIGVTNVYVSQIELGRRNPPRPKILLDFARAYDCPAFDLLRKAGYVWPTTKRATRLMARDWDAVMLDPSVRDGMAERDASMKEASDMVFRAGERIARQAQALYETALDDPQLSMSHVIREDDPDLPTSAYLFIAELYQALSSERQARKKLEKQLKG